MIVNSNALRCYGLFPTICFTALPLVAIYRDPDKSLARPGRKQTQKHARDAGDFNNIETRAFTKLFPARQGAEENSRHSERNINLFPSGSG